jgi:hypothetical protein
MFTKREEIRGVFRLARAVCAGGFRVDGEPISVAQSGDTGVSAFLWVWAVLLRTYIVDGKSYT